VNTGDTKTITIGGAEVVNNTSGIEAVSANGPPAPIRGKPVGPRPPPTARDTFNVTPDQTATILINGGQPVGATGDVLNLNVVGLTGVSITNLTGGQPPLPDGKLVSNRPTVTWKSIEVLPVPLGLGGTFDFQPTRTLPTDPNTQPGFPAGAADRHPDLPGRMRMPGWLGERGAGRTTA